ncbi:hypothetical protein IKR55_05390 [bacterium]|nr:hypothetical protein [bacterium]
MNVNFLSQRISAPQNIYSAQTKSELKASSGIGYDNLSPLKSDTVSFGAARYIVRPSNYRSHSLHTTSFQDILLEKFVLQNPVLRAMGEDYYKVLCGIDSVKASVFSICENIEHLVKSPDSIIDKIRRSGSFQIFDKIRATAYCDNPYNMDSLLLILSDMEKSGYPITKVPKNLSELMKKGYVPFDEERMIMKYMANPKDKDVTAEVRNFFIENGYDIKEVRQLLSGLKSLGREPNKEEFLAAVSQLTKKVPDVDIRLNSERLTPEQIAKLPEKYRYCIGVPQGSGYEDIQIRFNTNSVKYGTKDRSTPHELIILFGKNYYDAKTRESTFIYSNLRKFKELNVKRYLDNPDFDKYTELYRTMKDAIEGLFVNNVSKIEFSNAKCADFLKSDERKTISFTKGAIEDFERFFKVLYSGLERPYKKEMNSTNISREQRSELRKALAKDRATLIEMRDKLRETIRLYNSSEAYKLTEPKPEPVKASKKSPKAKKIDTKA